MSQKPLAVESARERAYKAFDFLLRIGKNAAERIRQGRNLSQQCGMAVAEDRILAVPASLEAAAEDEVPTAYDASQH